VFWYTIERTDQALESAVSDMDLRTVQDWSVRLVLRTVPGIDDLMTWGGQERQYQVQIDPRQLIAYNLDYRTVLEAIEVNNGQVGGQYINLGPEQYLVRGLGLVRNTDDIGDIVLKAVDGVPIRMRDIAEIKEAPALRFGAVTRDGEEVVLGMALARVGENAANVVDAVKEKIATASTILPESMQLRPVYDRTDLVDKAVNTAVTALIQGAILVAIVLFLFLGELRSAVVVIAALPMATLIAFIFMDQVGLSANLMSLAGLAIGIGMVVDGAVVITENSFRIMAERQAEGREVDRVEAVLAAAREVANPIAFAIVIIIVVFLPLFSLEGLEGKLFKPMAFNISFAMAGSLLLTLTLIPVLAALLLKPHEDRDTRLVSWLKRGYIPLLDWALGNKRKLIGSAAGLLVASLAIFPFLGKEFMPTMQEGSIVWRIASIPSTSLEESIALSKRASVALSEFPEVTTSVAMIGRAEKGEIADVNSMEVYTELLPYDEWPTDRDFDDLREDMEASLKAVAPASVIAFTQPIQMRVEELISGVRATLAVKVYGPDLAGLDRLSQQIKGVISDVPGVEDLSLEANLGKPQVRIEVNRSQLSRYGLNAEDVLTLVRNGIGNEAVSTLIDGVRRFDITAGLHPEAKADVETIGNIPLRTDEGAIVLLSKVTDIEVTEGFSFVRREQLQRYAVIQMDVVGRDVDGFVEAVEQRLDAELDIPAGYWIEWGGAFENQQRALARLALIVPVTIFFIFLLLYTAFNSAKFATIIIANVPFATIGGILALAISGQYVSVPSAVGFIAVFGVAMLNGVVLVSYMNELRAKGLELSEAVRQACMLRLRPVLMTAFTTILAIIPLLLSTGVGAETQRPLATVVIGGLISSTLLTMVLLPVIYEWVETHKEGQS
jgi:cobalt-zinc-cadmium resistance protein CzcA